MAQVVPDPFDAFTPLREAITRFMDQGFSPERALFTFGRTFPVDVIDMPDEYLIEVSLLGVKPEDVQITTTGNTLTIHAGQKAREIREEGTYLKRERAERFIPEVSRTITLPAKVDPTKVTAFSEQGILTIHVGKDEEARERTIPVKVREKAVAQKQ